MPKAIVLSSSDESSGDVDSSSSEPEWIPRPKPTESTPKKQTKSAATPKREREKAGGQGAGADEQPTKRQRKGKKGKEAEEPTEEELQAEELRNQGLHAGVYAAAKPEKYPVLLPSKALRKCDTFDILKKHASRKSRYLFVFPGQFTSTQAGTIGRIEKLNTSTPVIYLEYPEGRVRLEGTVIYPRNKYLLLKLLPRHVLCDDVFETLILFSRAAWIGKADANPSEVPLPWPNGLSHKFLASIFGGASKAATKPKTESNSQKSVQEESEAQEASAQDDSASQEATDSAADPAKGRRELSARRSSRDRKRIVYTEKGSDQSLSEHESEDSSSDEEENENGDSGSGDVTIGGLRWRNTTGIAPSNKKQQKQQDEYAAGPSVRAGEFFKPKPKPKA